jgi:hypothetical protein
MNDLGFESWQGKDIVLFSKMSRPAMILTQPPNQCEPSFFARQRGWGIS